MQENVPDRHFPQKTEKSTIFHNVTDNGECQESRREWRVYFFRAADGSVKIGCSQDPETRIQKATEWIAQEVFLEATIPGSYKLEYKLHKKFHKDRICGEWFRSSPELESLIASAKAGEDLSLVLSKDEEAADPRAEARKKARLGSKMTIAERKYLGRWAFETRPQHIKDLQERWKGPAYTLTDDDVAAVDAYVASLTPSKLQH